jgi:iron complex outermembrane receptor protein
MMNVKAIQVSRNVVAVMLALGGGTAAAQNAADTTTQTAAETAAETTTQTAPETVAQTADESGGEEIIVSARRVARSLSATPASVTVISEQELATQLSMSPDFGRALAFETPGLQNATFTSQANNQGVPLRGRPSLTVLNGVPLNNLFFSSGVDLQNFDPEAVGRVEIIRGASAVYGFGSSGGVISVFTKRPTKEGVTATSKVGTSFSTEHVADSFVKTLYQDVMVKRGALEFRLGGTYRDYDSAFNVDGDLIPDDNTAYNDNVYNIDTYLGFELAEDQRLSMTFNHFRQKLDKAIIQVAGSCVTALDSPTGRHQACRGVEGDATDSYSGPLFGSGSFDKPDQKTTVASVDYRHGNILGSTVNLQLFHQRIDQIFAGFSFPNGDGTNFGEQLLLRDRRNGARAMIETPLASNVNLLWGYDYLRYNNVNKADGGSVAGMGLFVVGPIRQVSHAVYGQIEAKFGDLNLSGGVRHEKINAKFEDFDFDFGGSFTGGKIDYSATVFNLGATYALSDSLDGFLNFSQGYDVTDLGRATFAVNRADLIDATPKKANSYEAGMRYSDGMLRSSVSAFYSNSKLSNRIEPNIDENGNILGPGFARRQPEKVWGVEGAVDYTVSKALRVGGTASWMDGSTKTGGVKRDLGNLVLTPFRVTGYVGASLSERWSARLQALYSGNRRVKGAEVFEFQYAPVFDYFVLDASTSLELGRGTLTLGLQNITNERYIPSSSQSFNFNCCMVEAPGRMVSLDYTIRWSGQR